MEATLQNLREDLMSTQADPTYAEGLEALKASTANKLPEDIIATFAAEQTDLDAAGAPDGILATGAPLPDPDLIGAKGEATSIGEVRAGRPAVVVLYRGAWCPYCNLALRTYEQQLLPQLEARDIALIAISPQKPDGSLSMQETNDLGFAVLSDSGNQLASALGVLTEPLAASREAQGKLGLDLTEVNADGTAALPMPTVALVDGNGVLRWLDVRPNYTSRTEPAEILAALSAVA
jgi:peroxiredoxin